MGHATSVPICQKPDCSGSCQTIDYHPADSISVPSGVESNTSDPYDKSEQLDENLNSSAPSVTASASDYNSSSQSDGFESPRMANLPTFESKDGAQSASSTTTAESLRKREFNVAKKIQGGEVTMPIAIVGMGFRFPRGATSLKKLANILLRKQSARTNVPAEQFNVDGLHHPDNDSNGTVSRMPLRDGMTWLTR